MDTPNAITVKYWIPSSEPRPIPDLEGIDDFRRELADNYLSVVKGRPAGAGGAIHLIVELLSTLSLHHVAQLLLDGIAFDLIKRGAEGLVLKPFLSAYRKLRDKNRDHRRIDIGELRIELQDATIIIHEIANDTLVDELEKILRTLAEHYANLVLAGDPPVVIHIPVFEDTGEERTTPYRVRGEIDETIPTKGSADYYGFWGVAYDGAAEGRRVYDVTQRDVINMEFCTAEEHWAEVERRWHYRNRHE